MRQILIDFFDQPTNYLQEFLYGSEGKTYKQEEVNPILQDIIDRLKLIYTVFLADCADAYFIQKIITSIMHILAAFSCQNLLNSFSGIWVYQLIRASRNIERCDHKLQKLVHMCL